MLMLELVVTLADLAVRGLCVFAIWNLIVSSELPEITFQQAAGIVVLANMLKLSRPSPRESSHGN